MIEKLLAERGIVWREKYLWKGKLEKVANVGMYLCFCIGGCGNVIHFNRWTPKFNYCVGCHKKRVKYGRP